jgi:hypothetical protein
MGIVRRQQQRCRISIDRFWWYQNEYLASMTEMTVQHSLEGK